MPQPLTNPASIPFWTLSRGEQVITCELLASGAGRSILRCGSGAQTVRSQFIASEAAATAVSETWRAALLLEGFRSESAEPAATPVLKAR